MAESESDGRAKHSQPNRISSDATRGTANDGIATACDEITNERLKVVQEKTDASCKKSVVIKRIAIRKFNSVSYACVGISALMACRDEGVGQHHLFEPALAMQGGLF